MQFNNNYQQNQQLYRPNSFLTTGLKGRPVTSFEEVKASTIDFDGSVFFFPDLANKKIYTKQINIDGTVTLQCYELSQLPTIQNTDYVTREEFNSTLKELISRLENRTTEQQDKKKEATYDF